VTLDVAIRFPATALDSYASFQRFRETSRDLLDDRYRREQSLATRQKSLELDGTCAVCLRVTRFLSQSAGGEATPDGARVPHWREEQHCGCAFSLNSRKRALLHRALPQLGFSGWCPTAVLGEDQGLTGLLSSINAEATAWPRMSAATDRTASRIPADDGQYSLVLSADHLHCVPLLDFALAELARVLMSGGLLLFTVPFHVDSETTLTDFARVPRRNMIPSFVKDPVHQIGWDILDRMEAAGFEDCTAECYWSEEFGYLGTYNMVFAGAR
jgi:hypothetical protein